VWSASTLPQPQQITASAAREAATYWSASLPDQKGTQLSTDQSAHLQEVRVPDFEACFQALRSWPLHGTQSYMMRHPLSSLPPGSACMRPTGCRCVVQGACCHLVQSLRQTSVSMSVSCIIACGTLRSTDSMRTGVSKPHSPCYAILKRPRIRPRQACSTQDRLNLLKAAILIGHCGSSAIEARQ
jgi:hypothetical protein